MLDKVCAKELQKIPLTILWEEEYGIFLGYLCDKLIGQVKISRFALQVGEATDAVKDARLITCVRHVLDNVIKDEFLLLQTY